MYNQHIFNATSSLRFTRWSRAGYAVFKSLSSAVTIGFLSVSISDCSIKNVTQQFTNQLDTTTLDGDDISDEKINFAEISELNLLLNSISINQSDRVAQSILFCYNRLTVKTGLFLF